jgi:GTP-binding protein EngB required for normal cell division
MNELDKERCESLIQSYLLGNHENINETQINSLNSPTMKNKHENHRKRNVHNLKRVLLLLDARQGLKITDILYFNRIFEGHLKISTKDISKNDTIDQYQSMESEYQLPSWKLQIVLTKCDLVDRATLCQRMAHIERNLFKLFMKPVITQASKEQMDQEQEEGAGGLKAVQQDVEKSIYTWPEYSTEKKNADRILRHLLLSGQTIVPLSASKRRGLALLQQQLSPLVTNTIQDYQKKEVHPQVTADTTTVAAIERRAKEKVGKFVLKPRVGK